MRLRQYQERAKDSVLAEYSAGIVSTLVTMPTGSGKTILFSGIGQDFVDRGKKVMVVAHRRELIDQACSKIKSVTGDTPEVEMADQYAVTNESMMWTRSLWTAASIQTICKSRRLDRFDWLEYGLVVIDEGHHALAASYRKVMRRAKERNPDIRFLFVTATADRGDGRAMGQIADSVAFRYEIHDAISDGWLVPVHQKFARLSGLDLSGVSTRAGDLDEAELAMIMNDDGGRMNHQIASSMIQAAGREKAVVFTVNVAQAYHIQDIINRILGRDAAVAMDGKTDSDIRKSGLAAFSRGGFQFLVNCALFMEGWDEPTVSVVGMARPTKSRALYTQCVGRGLRPLSGLVDECGDSNQARKLAIAESDKPRCLVLDFVGNSGKHKLCSAADLLGGNYSDAVKARAKKRAEGLVNTRDVQELLEEEKAKLAKEEAERHRRRLDRKRSVYGTAITDYRDVDAFSSHGERPPQKKTERTERVCTAKQMEWLERQGIRAMGMSYAEASKLCGEIHARLRAGLCSLKQKKLLDKHGYCGLTTTRESAARIIDIIQANGWARPRSLQRSRFSIKKGDAGYELLFTSDNGTRRTVGKPCGTEQAARSYGDSVIAACS